MSFLKRIWERVLYWRTSHASACTVIVIGYLSVFEKLRNICKESLKNWDPTSLTLFCLVIIFTAVMTSLYFFVGCIWLEECYKQIQITKRPIKTGEWFIRFLTLVIIGGSYSSFLWVGNLLIAIILIMMMPLILYFAWHCFIRKTTFLYDKTEIVGGKRLSKFFIGPDLVMGITILISLLAIIFAKYTPYQFIAGIAWIGVVGTIIGTVLILFSKTPQEFVNDFKNL